MNGMKRKADRLAKARRYTKDGMPRDANEWTVQDWADLWRAMRRVVRTVAKRHKGKQCK